MQTVNPTDMTVDGDQICQDRAGRVVQRDGPEANVWLNERSAVKN